MILFNAARLNERGTQKVESLKSLMNDVWKDRRNEEKGAVRVGGVLTAKTNNKKKWSMLLEVKVLAIAKIDSRTVELQ
ncbi:unnamed protein product [Sphenostylis stenocarpa]|uniref:Uncharacterized protein n=1 Tax=Sphenostylis stenocarpa TaxID=92480 RepID=A0AA86RUU1_9FABA|nr:unnamed protein product [Sphenostylis stenocarpa]